jgi:hypothetical protein
MKLFLFSTVLKIAFMKRLLLLASFSFLAACGNLRIQAPIPFQMPEEAQSTAIAAFYIAPISQPEIPVADASTFNKKMEEIAPEINALLQKKAAAFQSEWAEGLEAELGLPVKYGEALKESDRYERAERKQELEALRIKGKAPFNTIYVAPGGLNMFEFEEGKVVEFIEESPRVRSFVRSLSRDLGAEVLAYAHTQIVVEKPRKFGAEASAKLEINYYLFNDAGEMVGHAYGESEPLTIVGNDLAEYRSLIDTYAELQPQILTALTTLPEPEEED